MTYAQPMADPTKVMGRRIGAYLIDALIGLVVLAALFVPLAKSIAQDRSFATDTAASDFCRGINDDTFDTDGNSSGSNSFQGDDRFCLNIGDTAYVFTADDVNSSAGKLQLFGFLSTGLNLLILQGLTGASVGKYATGIRVVREDGRTVGFGWNLLRWLLLVVDGFCCALVGLITSFTSKGHRRVGDMAASTYVVRKSAVGSPIQVPGKTPAYAPAWGPGPGGAPGAPGGWAGPPAPGPGGTWAPGPDATAVGGAAPSGDGPSWDAARNAYIQYDHDGAQWVQWSDSAKEWRPIDQ